MNIARILLMLKSTRWVLESQLSAKFSPTSQLLVKFLGPQLTIFFPEFDILAFFFQIFKRTHQLVSRTEEFAAK